LQHPAAYSLGCVTPLLLIRAADDNLIDAGIVHYTGLVITNGFGVTVQCSMEAYATYYHACRQFTVIL
jgi:hypothetical protein